MNTMHYYEHALLSASKYSCAVEDTMKLHKLMDSSKLFFPSSQHRMFSHNIWFIHVLTELIGDTVTNTQTGNQMSTRDILYEHCKEDHNGKVPTLQDWLGCIRFEVTGDQRAWFNNPRHSDRALLNRFNSKLSNS